MNHHVVTQHPHQRVPAHQPLEHIATSNSTHLGDVENLADVDQAGYVLLALWRQHSREGVFNVIHGFIDNVVVADIDSMSGHEFLGGSVRTGIEPDHHCVGGEC